MNEHIKPKEPIYCIYNNELCVITEIFTNIDRVKIKKVSGDSFLPIDSGWWADWTTCHKSDVKILTPEQQKAARLLYG